MMMPTLHLRLLGDFSLLYADRQVTSLNTIRLQSLLAYLVLHRDVPQQRQHLAFLFWPDTTEAQARNNLRQLLHQLRQVFPAVEHFLSADKHTLHWHPVTPFHLDVAEFEQALTEAEAATRRNDRSALQTSLERVDTLYRGELLPGCYDEWILPERERLRLRYMQALEHLLRLFEEQGDTVTAIRYAQRLLGLDPLSEGRYCRLMRLFALKNDRDSAVRKCPRQIAYYLGHLTVKGTPAIQSTARSTQVSRARVKAKLKELKGYSWVSALTGENRPLRWRCADSSAILTLRDTPFLLRVCYPSCILLVSIVLGNTQHTER
jgi:DNA-binding SARP family transcriptional activator